MTSATAYEDFLATKPIVVPCVGVEVDDSSINPILFPFQRAIVRWAARKGRCAIFADTGLGKTFMQLEWSRAIGAKTLIVAPLSVGRQTQSEAVKIGVDAAVSRDGSPHSGLVTITNYENVGKFRASDFGAIVLDESSILKSVDGKTKSKLIRQYGSIPYRLCCTATPAPNDITELANHAEFLGVMTRAQMLATFFINNSSDKIHGGWRLKGHATDAFYRWLASWGMSVKRPSDIGFSDDGYVLPKLSIEPLFVKSDYTPAGELFFTKLSGITDRVRVRRETLAERVSAAAQIVNDSDEQWIVWHGLNDEGNELAKAIPDGVLVSGNDDGDTKMHALSDFQSGARRVLITKPKIAGFGMNFQNCHRMVFVGLSDSWESYYQCIRRCYRFGQKHPVGVHIVLSEQEYDIYLNVKRKETEATTMSDELVDHMRVHETDELAGATARGVYVEDAASGDNWRLMLGDSSVRLREVESDSVGLSVFSPPFATLFSYSSSERDLGNSKDYEEFFAHLRFISQELLRVTMPGRNICCHCQQLPMTKVYDGSMGCKDFRGDLIRHFSDVGFVYYGEVCIDKDPQAQAIRTKAHGLMFVTKERDSSFLRPAYADYILVFKKPGENPAPVKCDVSNDEWIEWARPIWYGIQETKTLQYRSAREDKDEKHICPLQLETIERCVRLWSNPGDTVLSPFAGIGSEGHVALSCGRKFVGVELKRSYWEQAARNLSRAEEEARQSSSDILSLISEAEESSEVGKLSGDGGES